MLGVERPMERRTTEKKYTSPVTTGLREYPRIEAESMTGPWRKTD